MVRNAENGLSKPAEWYRFYKTTGVKRSQNDKENMNFSIILALEYPRMTLLLLKKKL